MTDQDTQTAVAEDHAEEVTEDNPKAVTIKANNPSKEDMSTIIESLREKHQGNYQVIASKFSFKKSKDKETDIETTREAVELPVPYLTLQGVFNILQDAEEDSKELALIMECLEAPINGVVREILNDDVELNASNFPLDKITWEAIANMPKAQRRGGGIPKETWEAFALDYVQVMPEPSGRSIKQLTNHAKLFTSRLAGHKTDRVVLKFVIDMLALYTTASKQAEEFKECIEFLVTKADTWLNVSEDDFLKNL